MLEINKWESLIGDTPLIKLERTFSDQQFNLYAKLEQFNLGGSIKDRPALQIIKEALCTGKIKKGDTIIESSSGNMAIALAYICLRYGLNFIAVVDGRTTKTNVEIIKALGAKVEEVSKKDEKTNDLLKLRFKRVKKLLQEIPGSLWANQYTNENNYKSHYVTMNEIDRALNSKIDYLFVTASTCGTLRGCSEYIKQNNLNTKIIAVDAVGSVIFDGVSGERLIPGHGSSMRPAIYQDGIADEVIHVSDAECIAGCRLLLKEEALMVGGSSGAIICGLAKVKHSIPRNSNVVVVLADRGERYLDTIYNLEWVNKNLGGIPSLL